MLMSVLLSLAPVLGIPVADTSRAAIDIGTRRELLVDEFLIERGNATTYRQT